MESERQDLARNLEEKTVKILGDLHVAGTARYFSLILVF